MVKSTVTTKNEKTSRRQDPAHTPPETQKTQRRVHFGGVQEHRTAQKYPSKSEQKRLWYSSKEFKAIRTEIYALNISCGGLPSGTATDAASIVDPHKISLLTAAFEKVDTWRGLEHVRQGKLMNKLENRSHVVRSFLYFYRELGVCDPNALQVFSSAKTKADRHKAISLGSEDALEASKIYGDFLKSETIVREQTAIATERDIFPCVGSGSNYSGKLWRREGRPGRKTSWSKEKLPIKIRVRNLTQSLSYV